MKIDSIEAFPTHLPFKATFKISRGSVGSAGQGAPHIYTRILTDDPLEGWGEARPSHRWSYETEETVVSTIEKYLAPALLGLDPWDLQEAHRRMDAEIAPVNTIGQPIAKSALDMALHDLICRRAGIALRAYLGSLTADSIPLSWVVSTDSPAEAERLAAEGAEKGYKGFKVKLGLAPEKDMEILRAVRSGGGERFLWADPNQAYDVATACQLARRMEAVGADVLEQPIPANDLTGLAWLRRRIGIPLAVDESVFSPGDLVQVIKLEAADYVVVKVAKAGGLRPAWRMGQLALEAGMRLLGSNLTESRLGFAAAGGLFAALGITMPCDLNGPQFLADDPVESSVEVKDGTATLSDVPGIGAEVDMLRLEEFRATGA